LPSCVRADTMHEPSSNPTGRRRFCYAVGSTEGLLRAILACNRLARHMTMLVHNERGLLALQGFLQIIGNRTPGTTVALSALTLAAWPRQR